MPGAPSSFLLLVVRPGAPSSFSMFHLLLLLFLLPSFSFCCVPPLAAASLSAVPFAAFRRRHTLQVPFGSVLGSLVM